MIRQGVAKTTLSQGLDGPCKEMVVHIEKSSVEQRLFKRKGTSGPVFRMGVGAQDAISTVLICIRGSNMIQQAYYNTTMPEKELMNRMNHHRWGHQSQLYINIDLCARDICRRKYGHFHQTSWDVFI